jgi:SAM-dependent methyltransferase
MKRERWAEIQAGEFDYHAAKDESTVLKYKLPYWHTLLDALPDEVHFGADSRVLDIGCGGSSVLLGLNEGRLVGVDPLMDRYLEKFPFLRQRSDIEWINAMAEEIEFDEPFDVVFAINALDHVYDPAQAVGHIAGVLRSGGHCVVTLNVHNTRLMRSYYAGLYRLIDHHHPHQFTPDDVAETLFGDFTPVFAREIDDLWLPYAAGYYREVLKRPVEDKRKWIRGALNPFKWPIGFLKFALDMPPHKKRPGQRSIYSEYLFVFRLDRREEPRKP